MTAAIQIEPGKLHHPVRLTCKFRVDPELALLCQEMGMQPLKGVSIGKMMSLYPFDRLKQQAMDEAKTFVHYMKIQGNEPRQAESEFEVWGPFRERVRFTAETRNIEEGNPFSKPVIGFSGYGGWTHDGHKGPRKLDRKELLDSPDWKAGVVFMIRGLFTATRGHREETTGTVLVAGEGL